MPRTPNTPCSNCGVLCWPTYRKGEAHTCRPCRKMGYGESRPPARSKPYKHGVRTGIAEPCIDCGGRAFNLRCKPCSGIARRLRPPDDPRVERWQRESCAPGLTQKQRIKLLAAWKRRGLRCTYCPELVETADHIVPLVLGGTNHEGNLTPACRRCNSSKGGRLLIEWRAQKAGYVAA